jgi:hypothetical protein
MSRRRRTSLVEASETSQRLPFRPSDAARRLWGVVVTMNSAPRFVARSLLMLALLAACLTPSAQPSALGPSVDVQVAPESQEMAGMRPEGRLRKLHLVRPDLIPYPIAYEVYC